MATERFDLVPLLRELVDEHRPLARERSLELDLRCDERLELMGDRRRIRQTLVNLLANAIKYSRDATVTVLARKSGDEAVIEIADEGIGIPGAETPRIGERFFRASTVTTESGTGLGLAICREIIDRHGGTFAVSSEVGVGSTVTVGLPLAAKSTIQQPSGARVARS